MAEKDFLLADSGFKLKEQEAIILKLNHKLQEKDQLLQVNSCTCMAIVLSVYFKGSEMQTSLIVLLSKMSKRF